MQFATRARIVGLLGILIALALMSAVNANLGKKLATAQAAGSKTAPASIWGYTTTLNIPTPNAEPGSPPALAIKLPTLLTVFLIEGALLAVGLALLIRNPQRGGIAAYMSTVIGAAFFVLLLWAVAGNQVDFTDTLARVVRLATPLALGALAGVVCERSGVVNIGIEGMMLSGACAGYTAALVAGRAVGAGALAVWIGVLVAVLTGMLMAALHAVLSIRFKIDQIISGTVINIMAIGVTGYVRSNFLITYESPVRSGLQEFPIPLLSDIPFLGNFLFSHDVLTYGALLLAPALWWFLFRTRWGL
ncbi:MAG TPA: ABC transporter permease, partial [Herpetosiphonaceae bacterium]